MGVGRDTLRQIQTFRSKSNGRDCGVTVIGTVTHRARGWKLPDMKEDRQYKQWLSKVILENCPLLGAMQGMRIDANAQERPGKCVQIETRATLQGQT